MHRILHALVAGLFCLLLGLGAGTVAVPPRLEFQIPKRTYQECGLPDQMAEHISLHPGNANYQAISRLQPLMVQQINQQLQNSLSRKATLEDVRAGEYYQIFFTQENLYDLHTTLGLLEILEQGDVGWDCYIAIGDDSVLVKLRTMSLDTTGESATKPHYWTIHSVEKVEDSNQRVGYETAVQLGLQYTPHATQAVLVSNFYGFSVCLLCSDTIDTLVTVGETTVYGTAPFLDGVIVPGTKPEDGVFSFPALAARTTSFQPTFHLLPVELKEKTQLNGYTLPHIIQREGFTGLQTVLLTAGLLAAMGVVLAVWQRKREKKG